MEGDVAAGRADDASADLDACAVGFDSTRGNGSEFTSLLDVEGGTGVEDARLAAGASTPVEAEAEAFPLFDAPSGLSATLSPFTRLAHIEKVAVRGGGAR